MSWMLDIFELMLTFKFSSNATLYPSIKSSRSSTVTFKVVISGLLDYGSIILLIRLWNDSLDINIVAP